MVPGAHVFQCLYTLYEATNLCTVLTIFLSPPQSPTNEKPGADPFTSPNQSESPSPPQPENTPVNSVPFFSQSSSSSSDALASLGKITRTRRDESFDLYVKMLTFLTVYHYWNGIKMSQFSIQRHWSIMPEYIIDMSRALPPIMCGVLACSGVTQSVLDRFLMLCWKYKCKRFQMTCTTTYWGNSLSKNLILSVRPYLVDQLRCVKCLKFVPLVLNCCCGAVRLMWVM